MSSELNVQMNKFAKAVASAIVREAYTQGQFEPEEFQSRTREAVIRILEDPAFERWIKDAIQTPGRLEQLGQISPEELKADFLASLKTVRKEPEQPKTEQMPMEESLEQLLLEEEERIRQEERRLQELEATKDEEKKKRVREALEKEKQRRLLLLNLIMQQEQEKKRKAAKRRYEEAHVEAPDALRSLEKLIYEEEMRKAKAKNPPERNLKEEILEKEAAKKSLEKEKQKKEIEKEPPKKVLHERERQFNPDGMTRR